MKAKMDTTNRHGFRPHLSAMGLARSAPANAPACMVVTRLAERLALAVGPKSVRPNRLQTRSLACRFPVTTRSARLLYFLKSGMVKTPLMIPVSIPNSVPEKQAYTSGRGQLSGSGLLYDT